MNCGEQPDVMAMRGLYDVVILEVKTSVSDFKADAKKPWRNGTKEGIGTERIYVTPEGLLTPDMIPYGWQLWEVIESKRPTIKVIKGKARGKVLNTYSNKEEQGWIYPNCSGKEVAYFKANENHNKIDAANWLFEIMKRMNKCGIPVHEFGNCDIAISEFGMLTGFEGKAKTKKNEAVNIQSFIDAIDDIK